MIQVEFAQNMVKEYCRLKNIPISNGMIPADRVNEIKDFVNIQLRLMAKKTQEQESKDKLRISGIDIVKALGVKSDFESPLEEFMALGLSRHGLLRHFTPQFEIGKYRVDLACEKAFLVVECDGHEYHFTEKSKIERDQKRDKYLSKKGWRILHLEGIAIRRNIEFCVQKVKEALNPFIQEAA